MTDVPVLPKSSSSDALKVSLASLATVSNIDIDMQHGDDPGRRRVQVVSHHHAADEPVTYSLHKNSKGRGKSDPSPSSSPIKPSLKSGSVCSRGGDRRIVSNQLLDIQSQVQPNPGDTFSVSVEKQTSHTDCKDDTMELLKEADVQNTKLENFSLTELNVDIQDDTVTPFKPAPLQHFHSADIQVSA